MHFPLMAVCLELFLTSQEGGDSQDKVNYKYKSIKIYDDSTLLTGYAKSQLQFSAIFK